MSHLVRGLVLTNEMSKSDIYPLHAEEPRARSRFACVLPPCLSSTAGSMSLVQGAGGLERSGQQSITKPQVRQENDVDAQSP